MLAEKGGFDQVGEKVKIVAASAGKVTAELIIDQEHTNRGGTLHGGLTATLVDQISSLAVLANEEGEALFAGVSVEMNIQYISPAKIGDVVLIEASTLKKGRNMAFLNVDLTNKISGKLIARGSHVKYIAHPMSNL